MNRILLIAFVSLGVVVLGLRLWLAPQAEGPPLFEIEHRIEIPASAKEVWTVFADVGSYPAWNPYVREIEGRWAVGERLAVTIDQDNWDDSLTVRPTVVRLESGVVLHWHGRVLTAGLHETDHVFEIEELGPDRVRFVQREAFRGYLAGLMPEADRVFTERAFEAMNRALADRVLALQR